jgi:hypothetical protein
MRYLQQLFEMVPGTLRGQGREALPSLFFPHGFSRQPTEDAGMTAASREVMGL